MQADGGTLFLDEVANLPPAVQRMLLTVLQSGSSPPRLHRGDPGRRQGGLGHPRGSAGDGRRGTLPGGSAPAAQPGGDRRPPVASGAPRRPLRCAGLRRAAPGAATPDAGPDQRLSGAGSPPEMREGERARGHPRCPADGQRGARDRLPRRDDVAAVGARVARQPPRAEHGGGERRLLGARGGHRGRADARSGRTGGARRPPSRSARRWCGICCWAAPSRPGWTPTTPPKGASGPASMWSRRPTPARRPSTSSVRSTPSCTQRLDGDFRAMAEVVLGGRSMRRGSETGSTPSGSARARCGARGVERPRVARGGRPPRSWDGR